jgi:hypothetical protein
MANRPIDGDWVRRAAAGAQGVQVSEADAAELARTLTRALAALDALAGRRRFEDEPAGFVRALLAHRVAGEHSQAEEA